MIVVSKRAFLNILTQLMDAQSLVDANYYIADQLSRDGNVIADETYMRNPDGQLTIQPTVRQYTSSSVSPYHLTYGTDSLSPASLNSQIVQDTYGQPPHVVFAKYLRTPQVMIDTYNTLYAKKPVGNGLRILIFERDDSVPFIHVVCEYLSELFGEDITFIDRIYRNDIPGFQQYTGNKMNAVKTFQQIRENQLLLDIQNLVTTFQYGSASRANLEVYFDAFELPALFHIYEILFPNDPLPPGQYTKDQMVYTITSRIVAQVPRTALSNMMVNMGVDDVDDIGALFDSISDEELMTQHGN